VVLVLAVLAVFLRVGGFEFLAWDDTTHVTENPHLDRPGHFWTSLYQGFYMPLTFTAWGLLWKSFGDSPGAFHLANLLLHLLNTLLVWRLLTLLLKQQSQESGKRIWPGAALLGALLFGLHPLQVEPVAWVSSFKDMTYGCFSLATLLRFCQWRHSGTGGRFDPVTLVWFLLAMLSKPSAVAVVPMLLILELCVFRRRLVASLAALVPFVLLASPVLVVNALAQKNLDMLYSTPLAWRPLVVLDTLGFYVRQLLLPLEILPAYGRSPRALIESGNLRWSWISGAVALTTAWFLRRRWPQVPVALLLFFSGFAIVSGWRYFAAQENSTVYDRYVYLGMWGPAFALALSLRWVSSRGIQGFCVALLLALGILSFRQCGHWRTDESLWSYNLHHQPDNAVALINLGIVRSGQGRREQALDLYQRAVASAPHDPQAHNNLGSMLAQLQRLEEAAVEFRAALELDPGHEASLLNLARYHRTQRRFDQAQQILERLLQRNPGRVEANLSLGEIFLEQGELQRCVEFMSQAVTRMPANAEAFVLLGVAQARTGQLRQAIASFDRGLRLNPADRQALQNRQAALRELQQQ
jgi:Flp pilus assembly protein TadD